MKSKPYPEYKSSEFESNEIPENWRVERLKHVTLFSYGNSLSEENRNIDGKFPVFGSNGIVGYHDSYLSSGTTIIIGRKGSYGQINWSEDNCYPIDTTYYVNQKTTKNNIRWLYYLLKNLKLDEGSQDSAVPGLSREMAYNKYVVVPPIEEQKLVSLFLDKKTSEINLTIEKDTHLIELLKEKRIALINHVVTKGLDPTVKMKDSGVEWIGEIPEDWNVLHLKRLATRIDVGIAEAATHAYRDEGVPILRSGNIKNGKIDENKILFIDEGFANKNRSKYLKEGDLLSVRTGEAGATAVVPSKYNRAQCFTMLITTLKKNLKPEYFSYFINSHTCKAYFDMNAWGTAQKNISVPILGSCPVPLPKYDEQIKIVDKIQQETAKLDQTINKVQNKIQFIEEYKKSLIHHVVTGKVDVREVAV